MNKETYNTLIAQMAATIYGHYLHLSDEEKSKMTLEHLLGRARRLASLAGIEEPKDV